MSGASSIIRLSIRPRVAAAAAASMSTKASSLSPPSLSDLFDRQCKLPSTVNDNYVISSRASSSSSSSPPPSVVGSGSSQHDTWVQFQQSIAVAGFETGQTTKAKNLGKKNRGGKMDRKRKEREAEAEAALRGEDITQVRSSE